MTTESKESTGITICDGPGHPTVAASEHANLKLCFGPKAGLTDAQIKTILWLRHLGTRTSMKKNKVTLVLNRATSERDDRIVTILQKEAIPFELLP
ncbi:hypothetical protein H8L32_09010 [Undibacterium sp. CY18W]|uniref:Uncharacterized protein n=1 Tax=Undibacterium hunanense TaxID=2762292 RepID=A0ABR6ZPU5_9BURK|nr:hypothetical protein [Undibacterium hunanense]MBC3917609.1 hypothetical protein [Undibacterium hunanense]